MLEKEKQMSSASGYLAVSQADDFDDHIEPQSQPFTLKWWMYLAGILVLFPLTYIFIYLPRIAAADAVPVPDLVRVNTLDKHYLPDPKSESKLILIGDIHGNLKELKEILKKADYDKKNDHFVMLGDFITKGEDSLGVIDYAIEHGASCVRGNHEDKILKFYTDFRRLPPPRTQAASPTGTPYVGNMDASKGDAYLKGYLEDNEHIIRGLRPKHIEFLGSCPAILELGCVSAEGHAAVAVHAGLLWNIQQLRDQDPEMVMRIRSVLPPHYIVGSEDDEGEPWIDLWNKHQKKLPEENRTTVFYGHNARRGLELEDYTKGLDSGCVKGDQLSAIVITKSHKGYRHKLVSVDC